MTSTRIEELMKQTAYPESSSVMQAMLQVWNELQQDFNARTCSNCKYKVERSLKKYYGACSLNKFMISHKNFGCTEFKLKETSATN